MIVSFDYQLDWNKSDVFGCLGDKPRDMPVVPFQRFSCSGKIYPVYGWHHSVSWGSRAKQSRERDWVNISGSAPLSFLMVDTVWPASSYSCPCPPWWDGQPSNFEPKQILPSLNWLYQAFVTEVRKSDINNNINKWVHLPRLSKFPLLLS